MKRTNGFQLERAPAGGQTLPPWAAALCGGLCAAGALTLLACRQQSYPETHLMKDLMS